VSGWYLILGARLLCVCGRLRVGLGGHLRRTIDGRSGGCRSALYGGCDVREAGASNSRQGDHLRNIRTIAAIDSARNRRRKKKRRHQQRGDTPARRSLPPPAIFENTVFSIFPSEKT